MELHIVWNSWVSNVNSIERVVHRIMHFALLNNEFWFTEVKNGKIGEQDYEDVWCSVIAWLKNQDISEIEFDDCNLDIDLLGLIKKRDFKDWDEHRAGIFEHYNLDNLAWRQLKNSNSVAALFHVFNLGKLKLEDEKVVDDVTRIMPDGVGTELDFQAFKNCSRPFSDLVKILAERTIFESVVLVKGKVEQDRFTINGTSHTLERTVPTTHFSNVILSGPPGTGKSRQAKRIAASRALQIDSESITWTDENKKMFSERVKVIQFHSATTYEDFVEGLKPVTFKDGNLKYEILPGVLKVLVIKADPAFKAKIPAFFKDQICYPCDQIWDLFDLPKSIDDLEIEPKVTLDFASPIPSSASYGYVQVRAKSWASSENTHSYVVLIDEINRGKVAQIFGELLFILADSADSQMPVAVQTQYSRELLSWPPRLSIVATMNNTDKSVDDLDQALKRRFEFKYLYPDYDLLSKVIQPMWADQFGGNVGAFLEELNQKICKVKESADFQIGHSYFFKPFQSPGNQDPLNTLIKIFYLEIVPTLEAMVFRDEKCMKTMLSDSVFESIYGSGDFGYLPPFSKQIMTALGRNIKTPSDLDVLLKPIRALGLASRDKKLTSKAA